MLRLVGEAEAPSRPRRIDANEAQARRAVAAENRFAAGISHEDARWALAVRTSAMLDGGKAAVLTPERRRNLVRLATQMGLREFDANLVIAIVQDGARTGEGALGLGVEQRLALVKEPAQASRGLPTWAVVALAVVGALALVATVARWIVG